MHSNETSKKKKVTFSICTDKSDCRSKIPREIQHGEPKLLNCAARNNECHSSPTIVTHNKVGALTQPPKCVGKVCDVKKTLVRNVELALPPHCMLVKKKQTSLPISVHLDSIGGKSVTGTKPYKSKYAAPELYTTLCLAKEIQVTANSTEFRSHIQEVPQAAKKLLDEKILSRLNFPLEEKLYKDLISLNICEEDLFGNEERVGTRKEVEFRHQKDPEAKLSDFYTPPKGKEYLVVPEPPAPKMEKKRKYNGFSLYERSQIWNCSCSS